MMPQLKAFLDTIAHSEIGPEMLALTDDGYNVCVGSTPKRLILFDDYSRHPGFEETRYPDGPGVSRNKALDSDAAGRYQQMGRFWPAYRDQLHLPDFGPASQDLIAIQLIRECHALDDISNGYLQQALFKCRSRWASLPAAGYGQHENSMVDLLAAFRAAGGIVVA